MLSYIKNKIRTLFGGFFQMKTIKVTPKKPPPPNFKPKDIVSTKGNVCPWRGCEEVEEVGIMMIHGKMDYAVKVHGLPYYPEELTLELPWIE